MDELTFAIAAISIIGLVAALVIVTFAMRKVIISSNRHIETMSSLVVSMVKNDSIYLERTTEPFVTLAEAKARNLSGAEITKAPSELEEYADPLDG